MIQVNEDLYCCALTELSGVSTHKPERVISDILDTADGILHDCQDDNQTEKVMIDKLHSEVKPIILFTGAKRSAAGAEVKYTAGLSKYIFDHGLGEVSNTEPIKNPNSGNHVTLYVWEVDYKGLLNWWKKRNRKVEDE